MKDAGQLNRRDFLGKTAMALLGLAFFPFLHNANQAKAAIPRKSIDKVSLTDLARKRHAYLPQGEYDHTLQQLTNRIGPLASTNTGGGEDNCCGSATAWDTERS